MKIKEVHMQSFSKQHGLTTISWIVVIAIAALFAIFLLRLIPIYIDGYSVGSAVKNMKTEKKYVNSSVRGIKKALLRNLNINSVYSVNAEDIYVTKKGDNIIVEVDYEVREKIVGNLDFIVSFHKEVTIQ